MDRGTWWVTVPGVTRSQIQLKRLSIHTCNLIWKVKEKVKSLSHVWLFVTAWTIAYLIYNSKKASNFEVLPHYKAKYQSKKKKSIFEARLWSIWFIISPIKYLIIVTYLWINLGANIQFSSIGHTLSGRQNWFSLILDIYLVIFREKDHFSNNFSILSLFHETKTTTIL